MTNRQSSRIDQPPDFWESIWLFSMLIFGFPIPAVLAWYAGQFLPRVIGAWPTLIAVIVIHASLMVSLIQIGVHFEIDGGVFSDG